MVCGAIVGSSVVSLLGCTFTPSAADALEQTLARLDELSAKQKAELERLVAERKERERQALIWRLVSTKDERMNRRIGRIRAQLVKRHLTRLGLVLAWASIPPAILVLVSSLWRMAALAIVK